jgi:hypothetical protein
MRENKYNRLAIASLVTSIIGFILVFLLVSFLSVADIFFPSPLEIFIMILALTIIIALSIGPIVLSIFALMRIKKDSEIKGKGLAISGLTIGSFNTIILIILLLIYK